MDRTSVAAAAIDLFHNHGRGRQAKPGTAIFLGNHRRQPAGADQRIDERFGVSVLRIDVAEILVRILRTELANGVAKVLVRIGFMGQAALPSWSFRTAYQPSAVASMASPPAEFATLRMPVRANL